MTREEYINRTNDNVNEVEFSFINRVYMAAGDNLDKDQFCNDIKKSGLTPTLASLTEEVEKSQASATNLKQQIAGLAIFIAKQAEENSSTILRKKAIEMMGERKYIIWKIENLYNLWQLDRDLIKDLINEY